MSTSSSENSDRNKSQDPAVNPADAMSQIAWLDTVERLDTLLLEIRHFQCNVIFSLRLPVLYQALRFEECYLWGSCWPHGYENEPLEQAYSWFNLFRNMPSPTEKLRELADTWIIPFPILPEEADQKSEKPQNKREKIANNILENVQYTISSGRWNTDALRHYHNLSILQILKSNILHDKLVICHTGYHTFCSYIEKHNKKLISREMRAEFMIIRSAVTMRLNDYVGRFGDLQAQFDASLDLSLQEDPTPMLNRRCEQGFYTSFMSVRCQEIQDAIDDLFSNKLCSTDSHLANPPQIMHRWRHDFTSTTEHLYDDVGQKNKNGLRRQQINTQFINSSFWMPDRPDLLSSLAHEIAHHNVYTRYGDAWSPMLDTKDDELTRLLKLINHCLDCFQISHRNPAITPIDYPESSLVEISCDLIAASVEGHAYLYALFLELTACSELAYLLEVPVKRFDLDIRPNKYIEIDPDTIGRSWYYRLKLLCAWMKKIYHHPEEDNLIKIMINGIDTILDDILNHISDLTPNTGINSLRFWKEFTNRLCKISSRSNAARLVYQWRKFRSDYSHKNLKIEENKNGLINIMPNYSKPLNVEVQNILFRILLNIKQKPGRLLHNSGSKEINDLVKIFYEKYFSTEGYNEHEYNNFVDNFLCKSQNLICDNSLFFRHIYDIPWRCAVLNAIDFIHPASNVGNDSDWLDLFHHQSALGRELYSIALEFHLHQSTATSNRLVIASRAVSTLLCDSQYSDEKVEKLKSELSTWLHGFPKNNIENNGEKLKEDIQELKIKINDYVNKYYYCNQKFIIIGNQRDKLIESYGALTWYSVIKPLTSPNNLSSKPIKDIENKFIEKFIGYKINKLLEIIDNNSEETNKKRIDEPLKELKLYLKLWRSDKNDSYIINRDKTVRLLLLSLEMEMNYLESQKSLTELSLDLNISSRTNHSDTNSSTCQFRMVEIERLTAANYIATISNGLTNQATGALSSLFELLKNPGSWNKKNEINDKIKNKTLSKFYFAVFGRFDIISLQYTRPMSRQDLPRFNVPHELQNMESEKFIPFFIRREIAVPYRLKLGKDWLHESLLEVDHHNTKENEEKVLGFLSILLTDRSSRLSFIARLLYLKNFPNETETFGKEGLTEAVRLLENNDCLFLCEGWGDILIVFRGKTEVSRLDNIFTIQNNIYHDFLVKRTELVLTDYWLNSNVKDLTSKYQITSNFRICSDQELRNANIKFIEGIKKSADACGLGNIALFKTPGRSDFLADIAPLIEKNKYKDFIYYLDQNISSEVDDVLTIISKKIYNGL